MTMPSGLLQWGQSGVYNAVDDRMVITALANGRSGLMRLPSTPLLSAGSGLNVILRGGWLGVADAGDLTSVVVGSRTDQTFTVPAGGAQARIDVLWCDVSPDTAQWTLALITQSQMAQRTSGILLGTINVPANASLASQFGFVPANLSYGASDSRSTMNRTLLNVTGTHPGQPRELLTVMAGAPGETTAYHLSVNLRLRMGNRQARAPIGFFYRGGFATGNLTYADNVRAPNIMSSWRLGIPDNTANPWAMVGPVPVNRDFNVSITGMVWLNPWASLDQPLGVAVTVNTEPGASLLCHVGCDLTLTRPTVPNIAWVPPGMTWDR